MESFNRLVDEMLLEFTDLQQKKNDAPERPWHRRDSAKRMDAKNQHQVADRYKFRHTGGGKKSYSGELNSKIEAIRSGSSTQEVLSDIDIKYILKNYSTEELPKDKPKRIFAGVVVYWDPLKDSYIIKSDE